MFQSFTECCRILQNVSECYRVLQSVTEYYRVFLAHLLGPIFGLVLLDYQGVIDNSSTITLKRAAGTKPKDNEEQEWEVHPCFGFSDLRWSSPICKKSEHTFIHHTSNCDCHAIIAVKPSYQTVQVWHCMGGSSFDSRRIRLRHSEGESLGAM